MNFGLVGVLIGFALIGFALRAVTQELRDDAERPGGSLLWYTTLLIPLLTIELSVDDLLSSCLLRGAVVAAFLYVGRQASRNRGLRVVLAR